jgi:hypothetical protein
VYDKFLMPIKKGGFKNEETKISFKRIVFESIKIDS